MNENEATDDAEQSRLRTVYRIYCLCFRRDHLARTGAIAVVVGTWLTLFNLGTVLIAGHLSGEIVVKVILNYFTPFVVANWGLLSHSS
jgi:hypothetical protein